MELLKYLVDHVESLTKITSFIAVVSMTFAATMKRFYFSYKFREPKKVVKQIMYLNKYSEYMSESDKAYTRYRINDEIMRDITKIPSINNRKELIYIFNNLEKKQYIKDICNLQNDMERVDGRFFIKASRFGFLFMFNRFMSIILGAVFFMFIALGLISVYEGKSVIVMLAFLTISVVYEFLGLYFLSLSPTQNTIDKINLELAKIKVPE
ncbi:hypothetical protein GRAQ_00579 [Rahnella aquatilis CIP 78.65 = ATCC 33071]|uniref:Uncharacterized protein n=1 Tax=Rahnella aquatilis (strain ATCC 33071 / DSM 4594 / JCM 1683 / NBRC 105701 / NCIMB 13365 / CIP 78.65) TaxID=745277 RepID=H2IRI5_RAHAC|nr:hypothetical protein [Rahnella aquatilis]AEX51421.1 hypothetical protein Rahaq2_1543 [Rahnella aquatilis CIP 78.65 = ATCC 33071]KFD17310.1 hypothetical protein GRAQ_00579 [Rahnella aquatilis CIP 78.65 = ATCC 33071]